MTYPGVLVPDDQMLSYCQRFAQQPNVFYQTQVLQIGTAADQVVNDLTNNVDITPNTIKSNSVPTVDHAGSDEVPGKFRFVSSAELAWGSTLVQPRLLIRAPGVDNGEWKAFPLGAYVATTPGRDSLDALGRFDVTAYDRCYLLQGQAEDAFSFTAGTAYALAVRNVFRKAGVLDPAGSLVSVCSYPGEWYNGSAASKTLPAAKVYPLGAGVTYLQIVNELLKESGCAPLYTDRHGRWAIDLLGEPTTDALRWSWYGGRLSAFGGIDDSKFDPTTKVVIYGRQQYQSDVWNTPNRWRLVRSGLTFTPTATDGSDGMLVIDNLANGPASQSATGRVIASVQTIDAATPADFLKQARKIATDAQATAEAISLETAPWPAAWHQDLYRYSHPALPGYTRRVLADSWSLPLTGAPMQWSTKVQGLR